MERARYAQLSAKTPITPTRAQFSLLDIITMSTGAMARRKIRRTVEIHSIFTPVSGGFIVRLKSPMRMDA